MGEEGEERKEGNQWMGKEGVKEVRREGRQAGGE